MTSHGMGYMCKVEGKVTQTLQVSIRRDGVTKPIEWWHVSSISSTHVFLTLKVH